MFGENFRCHLDERCHCLGGTCKSCKGGIGCSDPHSYTYTKDRKNPCPVCFTCSDGPWGEQSEYRRTLGKLCTCERKIEVLMAMQEDWVRTVQGVYAFGEHAGCGLPLPPNGIVTACMQPSPWYVPTNDAIATLSALHRQASPSPALSPHADASTAAMQTTVAPSGFPHSADSTASQPAPAATNLSTTDSTASEPAPAATNSSTTDSTAPSPRQPRRTCRPQHRHPKPRRHDPPTLPRVRRPTRAYEAREIRRRPRVFRK